MDYKDTVNWMFRQLPMYQNVGSKAYKIDLNNSHLLAEHLGNPEDKFKSIHVAGTNGKGSTSHMLASILQEAGFKTGLYTSPHLKDFRERIKINGREVPKLYVVDFINKNKPFFEKKQLSFFEMTVGMAFQYFAEEKVDFAVVEVGLGGRLDSTNIITPTISVITNIGLDHTAFLGNTLQQIAREKGGIIKQNIPVVIGETQIETKPIFEEMAFKTGSSIKFADQNANKRFESDLRGAYQAKNINTVHETILTLKELGIQIREPHVKKGLLNVTRNTGLRGRWEVIQTNPKVILDTAHNKEGLQYVIDQIREEKYNKLHIVFGTVADKYLEPILSILPKSASYYLCRPNIERGLDVLSLSELFNNHNLVNQCFSSVDEAFKYSRLKATKDDLIFVGGSTFVVSEVI